MDSQRLRTAATDSQFGVDEGVCDPYWWGCVDTQDRSEDYSLFKLTALASSALTEVNLSRCRLWPQCVVNSGEMRLQWLSTRHHFYCVSSIFSLIYFCSRTIAFHSLCALLRLRVSLRLNLLSSPLLSGAAPAHHGRQRGDPLPVTFCIKVSGLIRFRPIRRWQIRTAHCRGYQAKSQQTASLTF